MREALERAFLTLDRGASFLGAGLRMPAGAGQPAPPAILPEGIAAVGSELAMGIDELAQVCAFYRGIAAAIVRRPFRSQAPRWRAQAIWLQNPDPQRNVPLRHGLHSLGAMPSRPSPSDCLSGSKPLSRFRTHSTGAIGQSMEPIANRHDVAVLVVEDEPLVRIATMTLVEDCGFAVHEAVDAEQAIAILERCPEIGIVLTDIQMAGTMNGLELAAYARDRWPPLKFIIVSGGIAPSPRDMPEGSRFFAKPYDTATVGRALCAMA